MKLRNLFIPFLIFSLVSCGSQDVNESNRSSPEWSHFSSNSLVGAILGRIEAQKLGASSQSKLAICVEASRSNYSAAELLLGEPYFYLTNDDFAGAAHAAQTVRSFLRGKMEW